MKTILHAKKLYKGLVIWFLQATNNQEWSDPLLQTWCKQEKIVIPAT